MFVRNKQDGTTRECFVKIVLNAKKGRNPFNEIYLIKGHGGLNLNGLRDYHHIIDITKYQDVDLNQLSGYQWCTDKEFVLFDDNNESCLGLLSTKELF